jgi:hypothetical protein
MALTKEALQALVALQQRDKYLDSIQREIDAVPPRVASLSADLENLEFTVKFNMTLGLRRKWIGKP